MSEVRPGDKEYNIGVGAGYKGAAKFKPIKVELEVSNVNMDETKYYVNEIVNQYADFVLSNVNIGTNRISFDIGSPSMQDLTASDIKFRIEEFLTMNLPPFQLKKLTVT